MNDLKHLGSSRRLKRVAFSKAILENVFNEEFAFKVQCGDIPDGAKIINIYHDNQLDSMVAIFQSNEFEIVSEGHQIPIVTTIIKAILCHGGG